MAQKTTVYLLWISWQSESNTLNISLSSSVAVEYNQPDCVRVLLDVLGSKEPNKHNFILHSSQQENVSACELAAARGMVRRGQ